ncbi:glycoside hydrolase family 26 protein [Mucilaginibacter dorajii]|uniref:GH26 domain-containing protein n=1 Tax=Mucilaginibacter dorajii TaxID=692994 RepID=A0ABP7QPB5_9SPHI|nr:glycoside hydrolase family 26 protein [Mucilaginibacter dorajii]MCS3733768.1 mannan endo-1,4-beta-mannosidase [Mucilaginibacter dorajii]
MKKCLFFCSLLVLPFFSFSQGFKPVNKDASPEVIKVLSFLYSIKGKHILSGQQNYNSDLNTFSDSAKAITGKYPALWGSDFMLWGDKDLGQKLVYEAQKKWREGYLVTIMWHQGRPTDNPPYDWKTSIQGKLTDAQWTELTTPNTPLNKKWLADIDKEAVYLKQLRDTHIPVLWRPYHEMNGVWFWWGDKKGENGIIKLWKMMYDRYTNYHHLNNLIWVWGANGLRDIPKDEAYDYKLYYPGADYVDILGSDVYHFDYEQKDYNELLQLANGKLICLGETGELPKPEILAAQPEWAWFMVWTSWLWTDNTHDRVKEIYNLPQTLNHDEVKAILQK